jgi:5'-methylthioadenosine phosphorylase
MTAAKIGIIGGSGLYQMPELTEIDEIEIQTPFGSPSDKFILGTLEGERVAFLPATVVVIALRRLKFRFARISMA